MSLFGDDPSTTQTTMPNLDPTQQSRLDSLISALTPAINNFATTPTAYTNPFSAPLSNLQSMSLTALEGLSQQMASAPIYQQSQDSLMKAMTSNPQDINDYFTNAVANPLMKQFQTQLLPQLQGTFAGNNAFGSDKLRATNVLTQNLTDSLASQRSTMAYNAFNDNANRALTAAGQVPAVTAAPITNQMSTLQAGAVPQQQQQTELTGQYQDYLNTQQQQNTQIQALLSALGVKTNDNVVTANPGTSGSAGSILSGIGSIAGAVALGF